MKPYYEEAGIVIYNCDCREVLPTLSKVDLVLTSPPYNLGNTTGGGFPGKDRMGHYDQFSPLGQKRGGAGKWAAASKAGGLAHGYGVCSDNLPHEEYVKWQHNFLKLCWGTLSETGAIYYNHKTRIFNGTAVTPLDYNPGLPLRQVVIWARAGGVNFSPAFYLPTHEWILILAKPDFRLRDKAASGAGDVWYIPQETGTSHPAPFPLKLAMTAIETTSAATVLDPFSGSGTTLRAAKDLGRRAIGVEIEEAYCEVAARRLQQEVLCL